MIVDPSVDGNKAAPAASGNALDVGHLICVLSPPRPGDLYWVLYSIYNTCKYWVYPILTIGIVIFPIQYNTMIFLKKIVTFLGRSNKLVKNKSREEEEDKVRWMRRMKRDRFFRKCRKKVRKKRMRFGR